MNKEIVNMNKEIVNTFIDYACDLHDSTNQRYGDLPYSEHIKRVVKEAEKHIDLLDCTDDTKVAILFGAAFHDSIEDARLTYNDVMELARMYMPNDMAVIATEIVYACTNEKGRNRKERANYKYYDGIRTTPYAPFVKLCDRMANYKYSIENKSRMKDVYEKEMDDFIKNIGYDKDILDYWG